MEPIIKKPTKIMHIISKLICTAKMSTVHQRSVLPTNQHMQSLHKGPFTLIIDWLSWKDKSLLVVVKICSNPHHLYDPHLYNPTIIRHCHTISPLSTHYTTVTTPQDSQIITHFHYILTKPSMLLSIALTPPYPSSPVGKIVHYRPLQ